VQVHQTHQISHFFNCSSTLGFHVVGLLCELGIACSTIAAFATNGSVRGGHSRTGTILFFTGSLLCTCASSVASMVGVKALLSIFARGVHSSIKSDNDEDASVAAADALTAASAGAALMLPAGFAPLVCGIPSLLRQATTPIAPGPARTRTSEESCAQAPFPATVANVLMSGTQLDCG
jgi:hypothetical protein